MGVRQARLAQPWYSRGAGGLSHSACALAHDAGLAYVESFSLDHERRERGRVRAKGIKTDRRELVFANPTSMEALGWVVAAQVAFVLAAVWVPSLLEFGDTGLAVLGAFALAVSLVLLGLLQRVCILGTTVQVMNKASWFRRRRFDAGEIEEIRYRPGSSGIHDHYLVVLLEPAQHRSWNRVELGTNHAEGRRGGLDAPLFVAFMGAVGRTRPDLKVQCLPVHVNTRAGKQAPGQASLRKARGGKKKRGRKTEA